jgi:hypothetical protein
LRVTVHHVRWLALLMTLTVAAAIAGQGGATTTAVATTCLTSTKFDPLASTPGRAIDTSRVTSGLGLTADQIRVIRARIIAYTGIRHDPLVLDDLGLTAAQIAEIKRRIAVQEAEQNKPPGWPCAPFTNKTLVIRFVRQVLLDNGFRKASIVFVVPSPRQIRFRGIQDGFEYFGTVVRIAPRQIAVRLDSTTRSGTQRTFRVPFYA